MHQKNSRAFGKPVIERDAFGGPTFEQSLQHQDQLQQLFKSEIVNSQPVSYVSTPTNLSLIEKCELPVNTVNQNLNPFKPNFINPFENPSLSRDRQKLRAKRYFKIRRKIFGDCSSTIIKNHINHDPRPFINITIAGKIFYALLDSGASVSILGKNSLEFLAQTKIPISQFRSFVRTADGTAIEVHGYVKIPVSFNGKTDLVHFCVCPSLQMELYLGIDFWHAFNVVPMAINEISIDNPPNDNKHQLTEKQQMELQAVKELSLLSRNRVLVVQILSNIILMLVVRHILNNVIMLFLQPCKKKCIERLTV